MCDETRSLPELVGKTIVAAEFAIMNGYQHMVLKLDDGTWVHTWEQSQSGEMRMQINNEEIDL